MTTDETRRLVDAFESATLPQAEWTHTAHLTVAAWLVAWHGAERALPLMRDGIRRLNVSHGLVETPTRGYHATITRFYIWAVARELRGARLDRPLGAVIAQVAQRLDDRSIPLRHYTRERLDSPEARYGWVEPDLSPMLDA